MSSSIERSKPPPPFAQKNPYWKISGRKNSASSIDDISRFLRRIRASWQAEGRCRRGWIPASVERPVPGEQVPSAYCGFRRRCSWPARRRPSWRRPLRRRPSLSRAAAAGRRSTRPASPGSSRAESTADWGACDGRRRRSTRPKTCRPWPGGNGGPHTWRVQEQQAPIAA